MKDSLPVTESNKSAATTFHIKEEIFKYLKYWKWFLLSVILSLLLAHIYLRYYIPMYGVASSILIKDDKKGGTSELSAFSELNIFSGKSNVANEISILKSRNLAQKVVKKLDLDISYLSEGRVVNRELYKNSPIKILFFYKI